MTADARPVVPSQGRLRPLSLDEVEITGGPWARRQQVNASATLAHCQDWMERLGWVANFQHAAGGTIAGNHRGMMFADSDVYKLMEAMAWEVGRSGSADADRRIQDLTEIVGPAQESDGYLNTVFGRPGQKPRYSDLEWGHELYNFGHLLQAAVARGRTTGTDRFVEIAQSAADHVCSQFGSGGIERVGGHPEIEMGLVELARWTGEQRYLDQAVLFIDRRGRGTLGEIGFGQAYFQDDMPIREATVFRGHAVRALYLAAGTVDVAVENGDDDLLATIIAQWENTVARRTYLTGGMGSHHTGEAFGDDYVLPPDRAYAETCAGIASVMLSWRLLLATGEQRFADLIERTLHNVVATSPAPDGRAFFYANPLHQRVPGAPPDEHVESKRASSSLREPWFLVACCPTNVARTLASLAAYLATVDSGGIQIHQYADCRVGTTLDDGRQVAIEVATGYPTDGQVRVKVTKSDGRPWSLSMRVPGWAEGAELSDPGGTRRLTGGAQATVEWPFVVGDEVTLSLPLTPRWSIPDPRIDAVRGCVAVERGPLVMCVESVDLPDGHHVDALEVDPSVPPRDVDGEVVVDAWIVDRDDPSWPYRVADVTREAVDGSAVEVNLQPYHDWATARSVDDARLDAGSPEPFRDVVTMSPDARYVVGVDFGTLSGRAAVVRVDDGEELATAVHDYTHGVLEHTLDVVGSTRDVRLPPDWALQVPHDYVEVLQIAVPEAVRRSGIDPARVIGIGTDFTACTVLPVLADGTPLCELPELVDRPHAYVKLWKHHAAQPQADRINAVANERNELWLARYGGLISSEWQYAKALQLLEEDPELYARMDHWIEAADWIIWQLCGAYVRNACTAGYKGIRQGGRHPSPEFEAALNPRFGGFAATKLEHPIGRLGDRAGDLTAEAAAWTGLAEGLAVAVGNVDAHVTAPAARAIDPGQMLAIMGTSTCHVINHERLVEVPGMCGVVDGGIVAGAYGYEAGQSGVGDIFAWYVANQVPGRYFDAARAADMSIHDHLSDLAFAEAPGAHGLIALDWVNGNRSVLTDASLTGLLLGQTLDTRAEQGYRALLEATAFGARTIVETFRGSGIPVREFVVAGGLLRNGRLMQLYSDVLRMPISIASEQGPALGSAIHAAVAAGAYPDVLAASARMGRVERDVYTPDLCASDTYDRLYEEYRLLHDHFGRGSNDVMKRLRRLRQEAAA